MRIYLLLLICGIMQAYASVGYSQKTFSVDMQNASIEEVLNEIESQTEFRFLYNKRLVDVERKVDISVQDKDVTEVLENLFAGDNVKYIISDRQIVLSTTEVAAQQQNREITGTVVDETGETIIGANILEKGTSNGTVTDFDGRFSIQVNPNAILQVTYIGYLSQEVRTVPGTTTYQITLREDSQSLDEVVVVGYGVQKKKLVTGATVQVSGEDITKQDRTNVLGALQGQTPGVNITQASGMPGEGFKVVIRGMGTIGNSSPLYVVDGVPAGNDGTAIGNLNPSDIESIDVLKDAASSAIYGARAANGVILITTKQGTEGKLSFSYDGFYGFQNVAKKPTLLNAKQYMEIQNEARANDGSAPLDWANLIPVQYAQIQNGSWNGTNWLDETVNDNAPVQNHAFNLSGGNNLSKFTIGFGYSDQEGVLGNPVPLKNSRYTFRVNSNHVLLKVKNMDVIKIGQNLTYSYRENTGIGIGDYYSNDIHNILITTPLLPMYNSEGGYYLHADKLADEWNYDSAALNPIALMDLQRGSNTNKNYGLRANGFIEIQPIKDLKFRSVFGYNFSSRSYRRYQPQAQLSSSTEILDEVEQRANSGHNWTWENTLSYTHKFEGGHTVDGLIGMSMEKSGMGENMNARNRNSLFPGDYDYAWLGNTGAISSSNTTVGGSPYTQRSLQSFFGRINYNYMEKYMLTAIVRGDGSSNFAPDHRWGFFPSVSAGWVMTSEPFMESVQNWMDFLKIRASWGQNGNEDIDPFQYLATIAFNKYYFFNNDKANRSTGAYADVLANPDITWETSEQLNFGVDARFLNSRLGVVLEWYKKTTKDWLVQAPVLASYGTGAPYINGGEIENTGVEIGLNWNDRVGSDFRYGINFNLAYNKNEVTKIANSEGIIHGDANALFNATTEMHRVQVGYPIGYFWGYKTEGIFQNEAQIEAYRAAGKGVLDNAKPGDVIFSDLANADPDKKGPDGAITEADKVKIGDPNPDFQAGLSVNLGYKGFDLSVTATGSFGHQVIKSYRRWADRPNDNYTIEAYDRWHGEGTSNSVPRLTYSPHPNRQYISDLFIEDADYVRIQNITLGYDFKKLFKGMPLGQARLYVTAQNLFTITGYSGMDPEVGYGVGKSWGSGVDLGFFPSPKAFIIGVNLKF